MALTINAIAAKNERDDMATGKTSSDSGSREMSSAQIIRRMHMP